MLRLGDQSKPIGLLTELKQNGPESSKAPWSTTMCPFFNLSSRVAKGHMSLGDKVYAHWKVGYLVPDGRKVTRACDMEALDRALRLVEEAFNCPTSKSHGYLHLESSQNIRQCLPIGDGGQRTRQMGLNIIAIIRQGTEQGSSKVKGADRLLLVASLSPLLGVAV